MAAADARLASESCTRGSGTRRSSACSSSSRASCSSAGRSTSCSAPTSAPASASSSRSPALRASWWSSRLLWITTASPLNTLKGRIPQWEVQEVVAAPDEVEDRPTSAASSTKANIAEATEAANVKAAVDAALVTKVVDADRRVHARTTTASPSSPTSPSTSLQTYEIGGSNPQFWKGEFTHTPQYAVVQFCEVATDGRPAVRPAAAAARVQHRRRRDHRVRGARAATSGRCGCPPFVAFFISLILFVLGLLLLHWREKDEKAAEGGEGRPRGGARPATTPN